MESRTQPRTISTMVAAAVSVGAIILLCAKVFVQERYQYVKLDDATTIALIIFAAVPWLAWLFESIKFGDFEFRFQKLEEHQQQHEIDLGEHVKYLAQLFNGLVGHQGRKLLEDLRDNKPHVYKYSDDTKQDYRTMLRQLRFLGFIEAEEAVHHIIDDKRPQVDLTKELVLTANGRSYLDSPVSLPSGAAHVTNLNA